MTQNAALLEDAYKHAMRRVVSPVAVVTFPTAGRPGGLTCTAICSATTQPPTLITCVNRKIPASASMIEAGTFTVNFLKDDQSDIARRFSQAETSEDPFSVGHWSVNAAGAPVLLGAASTFDCMVERIEEVGGHYVFFGAVAAVQSCDGTGLLYRDGFFRRLAIE